MILKEKMTKEELRSLSPQFFDDMIKIVIDRNRKIIAVNEEMHSDLGIELYDDGSDEKDLFGANIYWEDNEIEWSSTINIARNRELQKGVFGRIIKDKDTILELTDIVNMWIGR